MLLMSHMFAVICVMVKYSQGANNAHKIFQSYYYKTAYLGRLLQVDLINWVSNVRLSTKSFFDFNEICYVCRGR